MTVGQNIKHIREAKGMSQKKLGEILGVSQQMIGQYENSNNSLKLSTLEKISAALNVSLTDLIDENTLTLADDIITLFSGKPLSVEEGWTDNSQENYLVVKFRELNEKGQRKATDYVEDLSRIQEYRKEDIVDTDTESDS